MGRTMLAIVLLASMVSTLFVGSQFASATPEPAASGAQLHYLFGSGSATGGKSIELRVELTDGAPSGGADVSLFSNSPLILVPATIHLVEGQSVKTIHVSTVPTPITTDVRVTASYNGSSHSRLVRVLKPYLSSMTTQTHIRAGGTGKIIVRLSGRAYFGGIIVNMSSNRPSVLPVPAIVLIPEGAASYTLFVHPTDQPQDVTVNITSSWAGNRITKSTIVRHYSPTGPTQTVIASQTNEAATQTAIATMSQTPVDTSTSTSTATETSTSTSTAVDTETATATASETSTSTSTPVDTETSTATATDTATSTETATDTATATATNTPIAIECAHPFGDTVASAQSGDLYTTDGVSSDAGCDFTPDIPAGGVYADQITNMGFTYDYVSGSCGAGAPRFSVHVAGAGPSGYIYVVPGTAVPFTDCGDSGDTGNILNTTAGNCNTANLPGGTTYGSCADLGAFLGQQKIDEIWFELDPPMAPQSLVALPNVTLMPRSQPQPRRQPAPPQRLLLTPPQIRRRPPTPRPIQPR